MQISERNKNYFWGAVGGAAALSMVMFSWDFWLTQGAAQRMSKTHAEQAVAEALGPFCVEKFQRQTDAKDKLIELRKIDQYQQVTFIEKGGWATLPGSTTPNSGAAKVCAEILAKAP